jgi:hypothetical protein
LGGWEDYEADLPRLGYRAKLEVAQASWNQLSRALRSFMRRVGGSQAAGATWRSGSNWRPSGSTNFKPWILNG